MKQARISHSPNILYPDVAQLLTDFHPPKKRIAK